jgi:hypothetical protein
MGHGSEQLRRLGASITGGFRSFIPTAQDATGSDSTRHDAVLAWSLGGMMGFKTAAVYDFKVRDWESKARLRMDPE